MSEPGANWIPAVPVPVPETVMVCGLPVALSAMEMVPLRAPSAVGVKPRVTVQLPPAAKVAVLNGQLLLSVKLLVSGVNPIDVMVRGRLPVFRRVTFCVLLVVLMV